MATIACASIIEQQRLRSSNFVIAQYIDLLCIVITFVTTYPAIQLVLNKSLFQWSTKMLILESLFFANLYQIFYGIEAITILYKHHFMTSDFCNIMQTESNCAPYLKVILGTTGGMIFAQTGLMIERTCATFLASYRKRKSEIIGFSITIIVFFCSSITGKLFIWDDPLDGMVLGCFILPKNSYKRYNTYFTVCTVLPLFNLGISILLKIYNTKLEYSSRFEVSARFQKREVIDSTGTVCFLAFSLFILLFIYSVGVGALRHLLHENIISQEDFNLCVVWLYTIPFIAMLLPLLLIYRIRRTRSNRIEMLIEFTKQKQSQENHISQMKNMWS
ncbi:Serpentine receptor class alpha-9 [Caenorhabditis elegans]|uniref:Serpentine receptor class alpha-9 n=1 Tax=Caenorhabditis elegans TaxID=6239 RepID=SRA9_CAEEL|nr:Serpentine receptor class alpha-9 [Caenorhabditis elegans]Q09212.1 RecName: Full=Serpentine receptor class alpha-9; Short=Protein sra-9 [Caenorhabditis elegans]CAA88082.1 Serpentine receptor class alpha-9 [Caenorhabditis elegans]|eukprot:NP_496046.1 Serpentine receptor class alpha-9 [Caenorhabditis elegans]